MLSRVFLAVAVATTVCGHTTVLGLPTSSLLTSDDVVITSADRSPGKALPPSAIQLMGPGASGAPYRGDFEDGWAGWTHVDLSAPPPPHWTVVEAAPGQAVARCWDPDIPSCGGADPIGGYGNEWYDALATTVIVNDPTISATVTVTATLTMDSEPGYDYLKFGLGSELCPDGFDMISYDGSGTYLVNASASVLPPEYLAGGAIRPVFRFESDGGYSDEDCLFTSAFACQIDNVTVTVSQIGYPDLVVNADFQDGTFGAWEPATIPGVGDFAQLWRGLEDADPLATNYSTQVALIDDGLVVPGTGGSMCLTWCYGPGGYVVNTTGGVACQQPNYLQNRILSPVMDWPDATMDGIEVAFLVYLHEPLTFDSGGILFTWNVRSADTDNSGGGGFHVIEDQPFENRNLVYAGGPGYTQFTLDVTDLMVTERDQVQIAFDVLQIGWIWGSGGQDATPAPYFDNVEVWVYPTFGPSLVAAASDLAQDNFPASDNPDAADLSTLNVRFDAARDATPKGDMLVVPRDDIWVEIRPVGEGAVLVGVPEMHYQIDANPVFDPYRTISTSGSVAGVQAFANGAPVPDTWSFDLADNGGLYPGDVLHYYFQAVQDRGLGEEVVTLPADLSGYGNFADPLAYVQEFTVHALPSLRGPAAPDLTAPAILYWNDCPGTGYAGTGYEDEWHFAMRELGLVPGVDYDIYETNAPSSGLGNGIGGRTSGSSLSRYTTLLYSGGNHVRFLLSDGTPGAGDDGNDLGALASWMAAGDTRLFLTASNLASALGEMSATGLGFVQDVMGVDLSSRELRPLIFGQISPIVRSVPGNGVISPDLSWYVDGTTPNLAEIDAVTPRTGAVRLAEFTDPAGSPGAFPYSAATLNNAAGGDIVVSLPYDFGRVATLVQPAAVAPPAERTRLLWDVLNHFFGYTFLEPTDVPDNTTLSVRNSPNPFNPQTWISYTVRRPGRLVLHIYDLRGALVRRLFDDDVTAGGTVVWDGKDARGADAPSGVYFCEARADGETELTKMALIR